MQNTSPLTPVSPDAPTESNLTVVPTPAPDRVATVWVSRITSMVGMVCLIFALSVWAIRPGHYRFVLVLLTVAMFAAILHSYTFENGG